MRGAIRDDTGTVLIRFQGSRSRRGVSGRYQDRTGEARPDEDLARVASVYFGIYETWDRYALPGKILYVAGINTTAEGFDYRNVCWKPRWGRFTPRVLQQIARLEEGIDPNQRLNPPVKRTEMIGSSRVEVLDLAAANPGLECLELSPEQVQHLNYFVTLAAAMTVVKDFLPRYPIAKPLFVGFDEGDIVQVA